ncbi:unnamed protein product [Mycetohabitans rhizoxinica HKI 454]|uniref:Uncharacterized protein n=1 Tax=Mycetohabitans rhizoxinica (strain DSM 19002 / CIP 109453 / HKI 454) TaxID=882378 RepID=E5APY3_MYCRK|nr:unnamed protein product [Mycetohabitans rhizoxinica HKI 454]
MHRWGLIPSGRACRLGLRCVVHQRFRQSRPGVPEALCVAARRRFIARLAGHRSATYHSLRISGPVSAGWRRGCHRRWISAVPQAFSVHCHQSAGSTDCATGRLVTTVRHRACRRGA